LVRRDVVYRTIERAREVKRGSVEIASAYSYHLYQTKNPACEAPRPALELGELGAS